MAGYADTDDPQPKIGRQSGMHDKDMVKDLDYFQGREQEALTMRCATSRAHYHGSTSGRIDVFTEAGSSVDRERGRIVHKEPQPRSGTSVAKLEQSFIDGPEAGRVTSRCSQYLPKGYTFATTVMVFLSLIPTARASDDGDDFANNLFSDLAPILALFGEQVTKQFLSESSGWADNILFAMAPLGVITGVVSAIRVAGHPWLKALVGRGKEGLAQAELELMSSNSPDVGEMWNGQAVVRVLGKPSIFQFVYTPDTVVPDSVSPLPVPSSPQAQGSAEPQWTPPAALAASDASSESAMISELGFTPNIDILNDNNIFFGRQGVKPAVEVQDERRHEWHESFDVEMRPLLRLAADAHNPQEGITEKNPPNISLNARGQRISNIEKWLITIVGSTAQLVVLFFEYLISHHQRLRLRFLKSGSNPSPQAFPCAVLGTICLSLGMLVCSYVVDCASTEEAWVLRNKVSNCRVAWVQRGGTVNDQEFAPYLIFGHKDQQEIITSHRCHPRSQLRLRVWVLVATCATIVGFVTQFIGLRGMHWSASVAQLAATAFVTALRSFIRRRMTKEPTVSGAVKGYELDSMARKLNDCLGWKVIYEIPTSVLAEQRDNLVDKVLFTRKHLEHLSGWSADVQEVADAVCRSVERTLNYIYESRDIHLANGANEFLEFDFTLAALALKEELGPHPHLPAANSPPLATSSHHYGYLPFKLRRSQHGRQWTMSEDMKQKFSAVLSLWRLHSVEEESYYNKGYIVPEGEDLEDIHTMAEVLVWPSHSMHQNLFRLWMGSHDIEVLNEHPQSLSQGQNARVLPHRFVGTSRISKSPYIAMHPSVSVKKLFAQQIFSSFLSQILPFIREIGGSARSIRNHKYMIQVLQHSAISGVVEIVTDTGLGTRQEILMIVITQLGFHKLLPPHDDKQREYLAGVRIEQTLRNSRRENKWDVTAWHILSLLSEYWPQMWGEKGGEFTDDFHRIANQRVAGSHVMSLVYRFVTRILAFLHPSEEYNLGPLSAERDLFLQWLKNIDKNILESLPAVSHNPRYYQPLELPEIFRTVCQDLDPQSSQKAMILLKRFLLFEHYYCHVYSRRSDHHYENILNEVRLLKGMIDSGHQGQDLQVIMEEAVQHGYISVLEALTDLTPNPVDSERVLMTTIPAHDCHAIHHFLTNLFWYFPSEYRQFQIRQQPILLLNAVNRNERSMVGELLQHTMVEYRAECQQACLILAAWNSYDSLVDALLKAGVKNTNIFVPGSYNSTRLLTRSKRDDKWEYLWWYQSSSSPTKQELKGPGPQRSALGDYPNVVEYFLEMGDSKTAICAISVRTALQAAAEQGHLSVVKMLVKAGAPVNTPPSGRSWRSALQVAAGGGHLEVIATLLKAGADVNQPAWGYLGRTALQAAAEHGHLSVVNDLLRQDADVNAGPADNEGRTALQAAAEGGHLAVVDRLLAHNADVNAQRAQYKGVTALEAAAEGGHLEVVERLLERNAEVNTKRVEDEGRTALQAAAGGGHLAVAEQLLAHNAHVNAQPANNNGRTALQAAAEGGHLAVVNGLLENNADVNAGPAEDRGRAALAAAAGGGHLEVVDRLLGSGAYVNAEPTWDNGRTALQAAAEGGHLDVVDRLLEHNADVNAGPARCHGQTALQAASRGGHLQVVERLLQRKADVNAEAANGDGRTALQAAAEGGHLAVVDRLLEHNADVNTVDSYDGRTALQAAAKGGHLEVVERLLEHNADINAAPVGRFGGQTALQAAAGEGHLAVVERLLGHNAKVNAVDLSGRTALHEAADSGHLAVVNSLLEHDADVDPETGNGMATPLQVAAKHGHMAVVERLLEHNANVNAGPGYSSPRTALQSAAESGLLELVELLLEHKADVNAKAYTQEGRTALQAAAEGGHLAVVDRLLEHNADVNDEPAERGGTALQLAAGGGHLAVVDRLLEHNADVNAGPGNDSRTPLQAAAGHGHLAVVERLLEHNANVNAEPAVSRRGRTALQAAAEGGHLAVVDRLLERDAHVNAVRGGRGETALQVAAKRGHLAVVARLLGNNADVNSGPGHYGRTPLQAAAENGHLAVVNRLLERNADVNAEPAKDDGRTALQAAAGSGHLKIVNRLLECSADVNAKPARVSGRTALQAAAEGGHLALVNQLLDHQADANAPPAVTGGKTALQAARGIYKDVTERLLAAGATH